MAVTVVTPTGLNREQRKILEELSRIESPASPAADDEKGLFDKVKDMFS
ncbi:MAG: hypothetical protein IPF82_19135 [Blastocatellia bacterium]|nr:hypothetical protein [Blastocatellia bacterium]